MFSWNQGGGLEVFCGETRFEGHMLWSQNPRRGWSFKKKKNAMFLAQDLTIMVGNSNYTLTLWHMKWLWTCTHMSMKKRRFWMTW